MAYTGYVYALTSPTSIFSCPSQRELRWFAEGLNLPEAERSRQHLFGVKLSDELLHSSPPGAVIFSLSESDS